LLRRVVHELRDDPALAPPLRPIVENRPPPRHSRKEKPRGARLG
jgi:hypothetical protein